MTDPEYKSKFGMCTVPTSSSTVGVMQNSRVFCDFDISTQYNSIHEIKDILLEISIQNLESYNLYLTSTYAFYDLIQIMSDDNVIEEIRSDNTFADHHFYDGDTLGQYALLEGFGDLSLRSIPNKTFIPYVSISANNTSTFYIILPPNCISNKNIPLPFLNSTLKIRIYFKTKSLVISNYYGGSSLANVSNSFSIAALNAVLIGKKYDETTLSMMAEKYVNKRNFFNTITHVWKTINLGKPTTDNMEVKVSVNGKISDITFFIRDSDTSGVKAAQYFVDNDNITVVLPLTIFRIDKLTLKDSKGDYSNHFSDVKGQLLNLVNNKYIKITSPWNGIFPIYTFKFSDNLFDSVLNGNDNGYCDFDGNFNLIFNTINDFTTSIYVQKSIDLIITAHQHRTFVLDENGKLYLQKN